MATRMQQRRGTAAQWTSADPILAAGEIGFETDTGKFKMGNGSSSWSALSYFADSSDFDTAAIEATIDSKVATAVTNLIDGAPDALNTFNEIAAALDDDANFLSGVLQGIAERVSVNGDTMTGLLVLSGDPETNLGAATKQYADTQVSTHNLDTTNVHGITDTSELATKTYADDAVSTHDGATTSVHGIADTAALATKTYADDAVSAHGSVTTSIHGIADTSALATKTYADDAVTTHNSDTTNVHGISDTSALATKTYADDAVSNHNSETTNVHGIADTGDLVLTNDSRLSDTRTPTDNTVSTAKIVDSAVTADKLAGDSVTEAKLADGAVTSGKIANDTIVDADINSAAAIAWTKLAVSSTVSETELGYLDGVTSAVQTQIDAVPGLIATAKSEAIADATAQINAVIDSAPGALNTLNELAAALGDDANFASTVTTALDGKVASYTPIIQKTDSYTLSAISERDSLIEMGKATAQTLTIPTNASVAFPVGSSLDILQTGAGQVTIAGAAGVTVNGTPGLKLRTQWSSATLFKRAENTWIVMGDLSA